MGMWFSKTIETFQKFHWRLDGFVESVTELCHMTVTYVIRVFQRLEGSCNVSCVVDTIECRDDFWTGFRNHVTCSCFVTRYKTRRVICRFLRKMDRYCKDYLFVDFENLQIQVVLRADYKT